MQRALAVLVLTFAGVSCAQEHKAAVEPQEPVVRKRLQSVTWDLKNHKLVWVVERGEMQGKEFVARGSDRYEISPDEAIMLYAGERRGFAAEESVSLHKLLDTLALYCAQSVVWWDQGQGEKIDGEADAPKKEQVEHPKKPQPEANPEYLVAGLRMALARSLR